MTPRQIAYRIQILKIRYGRYDAPTTHARARRLPRRRRTMPAAGAARNQPDHLLIAPTELACAQNYDNVEDSPPTSRARWGCDPHQRRDEPSQRGALAGELTEPLALAARGDLLYFGDSRGGF
jgi:hypothetical protein